MRSVIALMSIMSLAALPPLQRSEENPRDVLDRAIDDFLAGRVKESVVGFDRVSSCGQSERRRKPRVAFSLRGPCRITAEGTRGALARRARPALTDARSLRDVQRDDDA
jgi:hypothetical protein